METITRKDIVVAVQEEADVSKRDADAIVNSVLEIIRKRLEQGDTVKLARFGNFMVRNKEERPARNPKTGQEAKVTARRVVTFRPSQILRNRVGQKKVTEFFTDNE